MATVELFVAMTTRGEASYRAPGGCRGVMSSGRAAPDAEVSCSSLCASPAPSSGPPGRCAALQEGGAR